MSLSKIFKLFLVLGYFSKLNSSTDTKTGVHQNARRLLLFNYSYLSYISHASPSAVSKLPNKTSTFHDFQGPTIKSHDFPGLENEMLKVTRPSVFFGGGVPSDFEALWYPSRGIMLVP